MSSIVKQVIESLDVTEKVSKKIPRCILGNALPDDFIELYKYSNGGEGFIGDGYLIVWRSEELEKFNSEYEVEKYAPGIILFGSNGGGEAFGFDTRSTPFKVVQIPFVGMNLKYARTVADSFTELLVKMKNCDENIY